MPTDTVPFLDVFSRDFRKDSAEVRAARATSWYARTAIGHAILRYEDVGALLKDPRLHQGSAAILAMRGVTDGPLVEWWHGTMLNLDGAEHTRLRRLVAKAFTPPAVERLRPYFRATATRLAAAIAAGETVDFVTAFAEPYPLEGICEMLGIPHDRRASFYGWAADLGLIFSQNIGQPETRARAEGALLALYACADDVLAQRRLTPGDDLVSALIAAEAEGDRLSQDELRGMIVGLIFAGNDTTRNQLALGMLAFSSYPQQWQALRAKPDLALRAVDEMMRTHPTIADTARVLNDDVEYNGVLFRKGTVMILMLGSANHDERVFGDASPFDITVERAPQMTFGGGIHRCLGMWLARAEMQEALAVLAARFASVSLAGEPEWEAGLGIDGPKTLPLRLLA